MEIKISPGQLEKLMGKLTKVSGNTASLRFQWRVDLLNEYAKKVAGMMGSVSGRGGYPTLDITGLSGQGFAWKELAHIPRLKNKDYETKSVIWVDTGKTRDSFTIVDNWAGVTSEYAGLVESGGQNAQGFTLPARPLFGFANFMVRRLIANACFDQNSPLGKRMRREFVDAIGWGQ